MGFSTAAGHSKRAYIEWTLSAADLALTTAYFNVYRSTSSGGSYALIGTAENPARYPRHTELTSASPPVTSLAFFTDYLVSAGQTWYYKYAAVDTSGVEGSLSAASSAITVAAHVSGVPIPDVPVSQAVPAPRSRLWMWWATASSAVTQDYRSVDFDGDFTSNWTDRVANKFGPVIALSPYINHIIDQPWGKPTYIQNAGSGTLAALNSPLGIERPVADGGAGMISGGCVDTFGQNFMDAVEWSKTQSKARRLTDDFVTAIGAQTAAGIHFSVYMSCLLASASWDDSTLLGSALLGEPLAANCGVMLDTVYAIDHKLTSRAQHPAHRAAQLCQSMGVPFWGEPLTYRADCGHWSRGDLRAGCISLGDRTLYARANPSQFIQENEVLGYGHIIIMGLGSAWPTYTLLYEGMMTELSAGRHVALADGSVFMGHFTSTQRSNLIAAARAPAVFALSSASSANVLSRSV